MATHSSILPQENPMDRGAWQATVHGVTKSWTQLSTHACTHHQTFRAIPSPASSIHHPRFEHAPAALSWRLLDPEGLNIHNRFFVLAQTSPDFLVHQVSFILLTYLNLTFLHSFDNNKDDDDDDDDSNSQHLLGTYCMPATQLDTSCTMLHSILKYIKQMSLQSLFYR